MYKYRRVTFKYGRKEYSSDVHIFTFNPDEYRVNVEFGVRGKLEKLSQIGEPREDEEIVCKINAQYFNMDGSRECLGTLVREGLYYSPPIKGFTDIILTKDNRLLLEDIPDLKRVSYWQAYSNWVIGTSFTLVEDGKKSIRNTEPFPHWNERHPRSAAGQKANKEIVLVKVEGRSMEDKGVSADELAEIMLQEGCVIATSFDGGGSAEMIIKDKIISQSSDKWAKYTERR